MNNDEKIKRLKEILKEGIDWYKEGIRKQKLPEDHEDKWDSSAVYDMSIDQFDNLRRGDCEEILEILSQ